MVPSEVTGARPGSGRGVRSIQTLPGWLVARVLVVTALALAHYLVDQLGVQDAVVRASVHHGLVGWDGGLLRRHREPRLRGHGARRVAVLPADPAPRAPAHLVRRPGARGGRDRQQRLRPRRRGAPLHPRPPRDPRLRARRRARRGSSRSRRPRSSSSWGTRSRRRSRSRSACSWPCAPKRWWIAAAIGVLAGLSRPSGFLLALPALIEVARGLEGRAGQGVRRRVGRRDRAGGRHAPLPRLGRQPLRRHVAAVLDPDRVRSTRVVHQPGRHDRRRAAWALERRHRRDRPARAVARARPRAAGDLLPDLAGELRGATPPRPSSRPSSPRTSTRSSATRWRRSR